MVTREWRKAKSAKFEFSFVSAFRDNSSFGLNILDMARYRAENDQMCFLCFMSFCVF